MSHVTTTIVAQMPCLVPVVKAVVGSIPGGVGFLVVLAQGGGPEIWFYMPNSDLRGLNRPKSTNIRTVKLRCGGSQYRTYIAIHNFQ
jgi:hypothetical protein